MTHLFPSMHYVLRFGILGLYLLPAVLKDIKQKQGHVTLTLIIRTARFSNSSKIIGKIWAFPALKGK